MGASGTIGRELTAQKRGNRTLLREKPLPAYRRTLPQQYQRWLYQDYVYLWLQLSAADKQTWQSNASRHHMTGFAFFMRDRLRNLPDIAGMWRLDTESGVTVSDSSRNANTGTIFGPTRTSGVIDGALSFDGIDDYVRMPYHPSLDMTTVVSMEYFFNPTPTAQIFQSPLSKGLHATQSYATYHALGWQDVSYMFRIGGALRTGGFANALTIGSSNHVIVIFNAGFVRAYLRGVYLGEIDLTGFGTTLDTNTDPFYLGKSFEHIGGILDNVIVYNRELDATEALRHSQRRYP